MDEIEMNGYPPDVSVKSLSTKEAEVNISADPSKLVPLSDSASGQTLIKNNLQSLGYVPGKKGWKLNSNGSYDFPQPTNSRCRVYLASDYAVTAGGARKLTLDTESYDTSSEFDPTTNYRFTTTNAGTYFINASLKIDANTDQILYQLMIYKNGSKISEFAHQTSTANTFTMQITDVVSLAAGDYIEIYVDSGEGANYTAKGGSALTYLNIQRVA